MNETTAIDDSTQAGGWNKRRVVGLASGVLGFAKGAHPNLRGKKITCGIGGRMLREGRTFLR